MITQQTLEQELTFQRQQQQQARTSMEQATILFHQSSGIILLLEGLLKKIHDDRAMKAAALEAAQNGAAISGELTQEQLGQLLGGQIDSIVPVNN